MKKPTIDEDALILQGAVIVGDVTVKSGCSVWYNAVLRGDVAPIILGEGSNVQDCCVLHGNHNKPVIVGKGVRIADGDHLSSVALAD